MVTLRMIFGQADVFVEVERRHLREIEPFLLVQPDQFLVEAQRRTARRQTEDRVRFGIHDFGDCLGRCRTHFVIRFVDDNLHARLSLSRLPSFSGWEIVATAAAPP